MDTEPRNTVINKKHDSVTNICDQNQLTRIPGIEPETSCITIRLGDHYFFSPPYQRHSPLRH